MSRDYGAEAGGVKTTEVDGRDPAGGAVHAYQEKPRAAQRLVGSGLDPMARTDAIA
jgi:hypothetical protein